MRTKLSNKEKRVFDRKKYNREYGAKLRAERKAKGLCEVCGETTEGKLRCKECLAKNAARQKARQQRLIEQGICKKCGKHGAADGHLYCEGCLAKVNAFTRKHTAKQTKEKRCHGCGIPCDRFRCEICNGKANGEIRKLKKRWTEANLCRNCGQPAITTTRSLRGQERATYCRDCYLKVLAYNVLGSGKKWRILLDMLEKCEWKCVYTGERLVLGDNLSFDHKNPICRFPEQRHDPGNIEPCSWQINLMKRDLTKPEFLALAQKVVNYLGTRG